MTSIYVIFGILLLGICGFNTWQTWSSRTSGDPRLKADIANRDQKIGELENQLAEKKSEMDKLTGQGKEFYDRHKTLESEYKATLKERDFLVTRVTKYETQEEQNLKKHEEMIIKLEESKTAMEDEKSRIRREDEERQAQIIEERDRVWGEHENTVVSLLTDLCKKPAYKFSSYDNKNLPEEFDGSLKPDFLLNFLDSYVIFDAKASRSQNLNNYIIEAVKNTAKKVKGKQSIYKTIFLVVPTNAIATLKKLSFYEEEFTFYVISPESLEPVLAGLKKIESYEFAEAMDPQERENIVDLIANFHFHISTRNAVDYHLMEHGIATLAKVHNMNPDLGKEVIIKQEEMRNLNFNTADAKQLIANPEIVKEKLLELTNPRAKMSKKEIEALKK